MIPRPYIAEWQEEVPWKTFSQVEQDLLISRTLIHLFEDPFLKENLAFRGGTALHKLYRHPAPRYSEDIDLVQIKAGAIKPILQEDRKGTSRHFDGLSLAAERVGLPPCTPVQFGDPWDGWGAPSLQN